MSLVKEVTVADTEQASEEDHTNYELLNEILGEDAGAEAASTANAVVETSDIGRARPSAIGEKRDM